MRVLKCSVPNEYRISATTAEHFALHMALGRVKEGQKLKIVSDCAAVAKADTGNLCGLRSYKRIHAGFWEYGDRIGSLCWIKSHLEAGSSLARDFPKNHIVGNSWADVLADEARSRLFKGDNEVNHQDVHKESGERVKNLVATFKRLAKGRFGDLSLINGERVPEWHYECHEFCGWHGQGRICIRCGRIVRNKKGLQARCYGLAGMLSQVHGTHIPRVFTMEDDSMVVVCRRCGYYGSNRQVKLRARCCGNVVGDGKKLLREGRHPKNKVFAIGHVNICRAAALAHRGNLVVRKGALARRRFWKLGTMATVDHLGTQSRAAGCMGVGFGGPTPVCGTGSLLPSLVRCDEPGGVSSNAYGSGRGGFGRARPGRQVRTSGGASEFLAQLRSRVEPEGPASLASL